MVWVIALAGAALLAAWAAALHHGLARLHAAVTHAWTGLDALLLERHDELARFADCCHQHLPEDPEAVARLQRARAAVFAAAGRRDVPALAAAEHLLRTALAPLCASADSSQPLLADAGCHACRERLDCIGRALADQREIYNAAVNLLNVRRQRWPARLVARVAGLPAAVACDGPGG